MKSVKGKGKTWYLTETRERNGRFTVYRGYHLSGQFQEKQLCTVLEVERGALSDQLLLLDEEKVEGFLDSFITGDVFYCVFSRWEGEGLTCWAKSHWTEAFTLLKTLCLYYEEARHKNPLLPWIFTPECGVVRQGSLRFNFDLKNDILRLDCTQPALERSLRDMFQRIVECLPELVRKDDVFASLTADWDSLRTEAGTALLFDRICELEGEFEKKKEELAEQLAENAEAGSARIDFLRKTAIPLAVLLVAAAVLLVIVTGQEGASSEEAEPAFLWQEIGGMKLDSQGRVVTAP